MRGAGEENALSLNAVIRNILILRHRETDGGAHSTPQRARQVFFARMCAVSRLNFASNFSVEN